MLLIDFSKGVIASDEKGFKEPKIVVKRIVNAIIIFCIPWIVELFTSFLKEAGFNTSYQECMTNAKSGNFTYYDQLQSAVDEFNNKILEGVEEIKNNSDISSIIGNVDTTNGISMQDGAKIADSLVAKAQSEIGNKDCDHFGKGGTWNTDHSACSNWCSIFVTWALSNTNVSSNTTLWNYITNNGEYTGICNGRCAGDFPSIFDKNKNLVYHKSTYYGGTYTPKKGDLAIFWWNEYDDDNASWDGTIDGTKGAIHAHHAAIVINVNSDGTIHTIQGSGSAHMVREIDRRVDEIIVYGSWYGN